MSFGDKIDYGNVKIKKFGSVFEKIVRKKKFLSRNKYRALLNAWEKVVGSEIYEATQIKAYEKGKLKICVDSPVLLHELKGFMKENILIELKYAYKDGDVYDIVFMAGKKKIE